MATKQKYPDTLKTKALYQLSRSLALLFDSEEDSDLTIKCENRTWKLHRVVLRAGSDYFKMACEKDKFKEGVEDVIELKEDDPRLVGIMLRYFYVHDYEINYSEEPALAVHAKMYAMADKYGVPLLKDLARDKFSRDLEVGNDVDIPSFVAAVEVIYNTTLPTDRALRDALVRPLSENHDQLRASKEFMGLILGKLGEGEFAVEVLDAWDGLKTKANRTWRCEACNTKGEGVPSKCTRDCGWMWMRYSPIQ